MTELRNYQQEMLTKLNKAWEKHRSVMVQMPTGTGKTHLMATIIRERIADGVLIVAHRKELLDQIRATVTAFGIDLKKEPIVVESIQKLSRHIYEVKYEPSLIIVDEAHHALAETYKMLWERWPKAKFLGLTATPCRLSGEEFTDLFDLLLQSWSIRKFIDEKWLSDLDYVSARPNSIAVQKVLGLKKRGTDGDYQTKELALVLDKPESIEHLYRSYREFADGKKGIVYAINIEHARHIGEYYQAQGVRCCVIDSNTPDKLRQQLVDDYQQGKIDLLINVSIFDEGYNCPEVEVIQLARPTLSLSKYLQQVGRGMRISEGKKEVTILDQVGLYLMFGLPTSDRNWSAMFNGRLAGKGKLQTSPKTIEKRGTAPDDKVLINEQMIRLKWRKAETAQATPSQNIVNTENISWANLIRRGAWHNDHIALIHFDRVYVKDGESVRYYDVYGYHKDSIILRADKVIGFQQLMNDGSCGQFFEQTPPGITKIPDFKLLGLNKSNPSANSKGAAPNIHEQEMLHLLGKAKGRYHRILLWSTNYSELLHVAAEEIVSGITGHKRRVLVCNSDNTKSNWLTEAGFKAYDVSEIGWSNQHELLTINQSSLSKQITMVKADYQPTLIVIQGLNADTFNDLKEMCSRWPDVAILAIDMLPNWHILNKDLSLFDTILMSWDMSNQMQNEKLHTIDGGLSITTAKPGVEIFFQNRLIGIRKDGKQTCPAKFSRIDELIDSDLFAIATTIKAGGREQRTIIDKDGIELDIKLEGKVTEYKYGVFKVEQSTDSGDKETVYVDVIEMKKYRKKPDIFRIGQINFILKESRIRQRLASKNNGEEPLSVKQKEMFIGQHFVIMKDFLLMMNDPTKRFHIYGYAGETIIVRDPDTSSFRTINIWGVISQPFSTLNPSYQIQQEIGPQLVIHLKRADNCYLT